MDAVFRAIFLYFFIFIYIRMSGRRIFAQLTAFDFVLLLLIGEAAQQGLIGDDFSVTNAVIVISTLMSLDILLTLIKSKWLVVNRLLEGTPTILINDGELLQDKINRSRIDKRDIMEAARTIRGLERMDQIKYAILEKNGSISIIPYNLDNKSTEPA